MTCAPLAFPLSATCVPQVLVTTTRQALNDIRADVGPADVQARQETYRHAIAKAERAVTKASKAISDVKAAAADMSGAPRVQPAACSAVVRACVNRAPVRCRRA